MAYGTFLDSIFSSSRCMCGSRGWWKRFWQSWRIGTFGGGEENASADMGHFIEAITHIAKTRYMTALIVHHSNATGAKARGHTSLKCGANAMFECVGVKSEKGHLQAVTLVNEKQKDDRDAEAIYLRAEPLRNSLVLEWEPMPEKVSNNQRVAKAAEMRRADMVKVLGAAERYRWEEWRLASGGIKKATFSRRIAQLIKDGEVFLEDGYYYVYPATEDLAALDEEKDSVPLHQKK
jgi:hypothetical protein